MLEIEGPAEIRGMAWSPDGLHIASIGADHTVRIWDATSGAEVVVLDGYGGAIWSPDSHTLVVTDSVNNQMHIWDMRDNSVYAICQGQRTSNIAWSPDGMRIAYGSGNNTSGEIHICDPTTGNELAVWTGHEYIVSLVSWSPDGDLLASRSGDGTLRLWDTATGKELTALPTRVQSLDWAPDGTRIFSGEWMWKSEMRVWGVVAQAR